MMSRRHRRACIQPNGFDPRMVPEIAAGYFWLASSASGLGTANFKIPEGNGRTSFDLIQATIAQQPTALTENGRTQFRSAKLPTVNGVTCAGSVRAGWSTSTMLAGWFRLPDASGDITGTTTLFQHSLATGNQRRLSLSTASSNDTLRVNASDAGSSFLVTQFPSPFVGGGWHYVEVFDDLLNALGGSAATDRIKMFADLVQLTPGVTVSTGTTLFDGLATLSLGSAVSTANAATGVADTLDWSNCYYGNGIPSLANRDRLRRHLAPTTVS